MSNYNLFPSAAPIVEGSVAQARFAYRVSAALSEGLDVGDTQLPHDIGERLKVARQMAVDRAVQRARAAAPQVAGGAQVQSNGRGAATLSWFGSPFGGSAPRWLRFASVLPLVALVAGLVAIQQQHTEAAIAEAAQIDADLLGDAVPPAAYRDAGFVEFLKTPRN